MMTMSAAQYGAIMYISQPLLQQYASTQIENALWRGKDLEEYSSTMKQEAWGV